MNFKQLTVAVLLFVLLSACSASKGSEYIGIWENINPPKDRFECVKNGDSFLLNDKKEKWPATLEKDGTLKMAVTGGALVISYSKNSDTIILGGNEYKRIK